MFSASVLAQLCQDDCTKGDNIAYVECVGEGECGNVKNFTWAGVEYPFGCDNMELNVDTPIPEPFCFGSYKYYEFRCYKGKQYDKNIVFPTASHEYCEFGCENATCLEGDWGPACPEFPCEYDARYITNSGGTSDSPPVQYSSSDYPYEFSLDKTTNVIFTLNYHLYSKTPQGPGYTTNYMRVYIDDTEVFVDESEQGLTVDKEEEIEFGALNPGVHYIRIEAQPFELHYGIDWFKLEEGEDTCVDAICSLVQDGCCPSSCSAGSDVDCCEDAGKCWVETRGCYDDCELGEGNCSIQLNCEVTNDGCCPDWCAAGSDKDCCENAGKCWIDGKGCYDECDSVTCVDGQTQTCEPDQDYCTAGVQTCTNGEWGNCTGYTLPENETCNNEYNETDDNDYNETEEEDDDEEDETDDNEDTPVDGGCKPNKVLICHVVGKPHEICVAQSALDAHLAHEDYTGYCESYAHIKDKKDNKKTKEKSSDETGNQEEVKEECNGCEHKDKCLQYGERIKADKERKYCDSSNTLSLQKNEAEECMNNYECRSNLCVDDQCIKQGFLQKILNWFKNFGSILGNVLKTF